MPGQIRLAGMDGVYWIKTGNEKYQQIAYGTAAVFSVLLLEDFFKSVQ